MTIISEKDKTFIKENIRKYSFDEFSTILGIPRNSVVQHISKSPKYKIEDYWNLFNVDVDAFLNPRTREVSYLLGLIWADGFVGKVNNWISIDNLAEDMRELTPIFLETGEWNVLGEKSRKIGRPTITISTFNKPINTFLKENDFTEKSLKSPCKILSKIPKNLWNYFYRGWLDGDGWITNGVSGSVGFASSFGQDWTCFNTLEKEVLFNYSVCKSGQIRNGKTQRSSALTIKPIAARRRILDYIYQNREKDGIGLSRKYNKYLEFLENDFKEQFKNKTGFRGVGKAKKKFRCCYKIEGKRVVQYGFNSAEDAARHYDEQIVKRNGFNANTNFPIENYLHLIKT